MYYSKYTKVATGNFDEEVTKQSIGTPYFRNGAPMKYQCIMENVDKLFSIFLKIMSDKSMKNKQS